MRKGCHKVGRKNIQALAHHELLKQQYVDHASLFLQNHHDNANQLTETA